MTGSACSMPPSVSSLNTTPKPNVSSGALRSQTRISACGSSALASAAKYNPPGPPPRTAIRMGIPSWPLPIEQTLRAAITGALARRFRFAKPIPLQLAGGRTRQRRDELDGTRILVRRDRLLGEVLQLGDLRGVLRGSLAK